MREVTLTQQLHQELIGTHGSGSRRESSPLKTLTSSQFAALHNVTRFAEGRRCRAERIISDILKRQGISLEEFSEAVENLKRNARIALHFHPDKLDGHMRIVARSLLEQGVYRNQFETSLSNGSESAYPGGERDVWERKLFGGAYHIDGVPNHERPKYGALDIWQHPDGPSPRFGSCFFLLNQHVSSRCTFTYLDSHDDPQQMGTVYELTDIMAAMLIDAERDGYVLGENNTKPRQLLDRLLRETRGSCASSNKTAASRNLDYYIEAQVHGEVALQRDVDVLVADPAYKNTTIGRTLEGLCSQYAIELRWHMGFVLEVDNVPVNFRGPVMPELAQRVATADLLDVTMICSAARDVKRRPHCWTDFGTEGDVLRLLRYLWHVLVKYGEPATSQLLMGATDVPPNARP